MENEPGDTPEETVEEQTEEETQAPDPIAELKLELKNSKSESARKLDFIQTQLSQLAQGLQKPAQEAPIDKSLIYDNPDEYARLIEERAASRAEKRIMDKLQSTRQQDYKAASMQTQFPELKDENSEAYRTATREYDALPKHMQGTAEGLELAVQRAANQLGLVPANKRKQTRVSDDYIPPTTNTGRRTSARDKDLDPKALEFGQLLAQATGRDPNDPKLIEGLKQASKRTDWKRYK